MPSVNFYLKKASSLTNKSLIILQFFYENERLLFSFGESIEPKKWNKARQRAKSLQELTSQANQQYSLNDLLDKLEDLTLETYFKEKIKGTPSHSVIKSELQSFLKKNHPKNIIAEPTLFDLIERFIKGEINYGGKAKKSSTIKGYITVKNHLLGFQKSSGPQVNFSTITLDFFYKFTNYLRQEQHVAHNGIAKYIDILKVFMSEAVELKYTSNYDFKSRNFRVAEDPTYATYLTENELEVLYKYDLSRNKRLEQVRDLFIFGCWVGLRYSDYSTVEFENIFQNDGDYYLKIITDKTDELVIIPCHSIVLEIFKKYDHAKNKLPPSISNQKFNEYIKEAAKLAGLNEIGRLAGAPKEELWQTLSSHTARRSFATNYYLSGFPKIELMKITGHQTETAFMKYIKISKMDAAKSLMKHNKSRNWSSVVQQIM